MMNLPANPVQRGQTVSTATATATTNWDGLTFPQVVQQTVLCHPSWSDDEVVSYMVAETVWGTTHTKRAIAVGVANYFGVRHYLAKPGEQPRIPDGAIFATPTTAPKPVAPTGGGNIWINIREAAALVPAVEGFTSTYFALTEDDGVLRFYKLDRPVKGKWKGYTFLKVQASDDFYPIRKPGRILDILERLTADLETALSTYGKEIKKCGVCHRTLTLEESRDRGMGSVCAGRMGL